MTTLTPLPLLLPYLYLGVIVANITVLLTITNPSPPFRTPPTRAIGHTCSSGGGGRSISWSQEKE